MMSRFELLIIRYQIIRNTTENGPETMIGRNRFVPVN